MPDDSRRTKAQLLNDLLVAAGSEPKYQVPPEVEEQGLTPALADRD